MSYKLIKASLPVMTLGALSQVAQADTLDDAIKDAKDAGFSTSVQTRTEKVSSQSEADRLNQEEANRVQALAQRIQTQIQKTETSDQSVRQVVTSVLTDQAKESTESAAQNQAIVRENTEAQKAYEESVRAIEAKNAKAQADYEAQKAKVAEENAQAQKAYEAEKAKVEADNANNKKGYEEAIKRIAAENKQAQDAYQTARQKAESEIHTKEWSDTKVIEEAKAAGVAIRPTKIVDKGTVKESDLATIQSEYDKAVADVRAKLEIAKKEAAKGAIELKADNELKQFVKAQQDAIKAIINADNANTATTHIHTVVRRGTVMANPDRLKQAYQDLLQTVKDNAVRNFNAQQAYYQSQGKTEDEAIALTRKAVAPHFLTRIDGLNPEFKQALLAGKPKITEVPVTGTLPLVPIGTDLTNTTDPTVVAYKKAISDIEAKLYEVWRSNEVVSELTQNDPNGSAPAFSDHYEEDLKKYQDAQKYLEGMPPSMFVTRANDQIKAASRFVIYDALDNTFQGGSRETSFSDENNVDITKSSDSVQFLAKPEKTAASMFDIRTPAKTTTTPEFFQPQDSLSGSKTTLVRIPKGQSITVRYTLKNGQPYISGKQITDNYVRAQWFTQDTVTQYLKEDKELHDEDIQDVHTIEMKITNNGGVNDGDIIVAVRNNTRQPFYIGVANGTGIDDRIQWKLNADEPSLAFHYQQDVSFRNAKNQLLALGLPQGEVTQEPHYYHGKQMGYTTRIKSNTHYVSKLFRPLAEAKPIEKVDTTDIPINPNGEIDTNIQWNGYREMIDSGGQDIFTPPAGWKDKYMWTSITYGMADATTFSAIHKTYNKPLVDWAARDDRSNFSSFHETGSFTEAYSINGTDYNIELIPRPIEPPKDVKVPKLTVDLVREVALPTASANDPVDPATVVSIEPVKWIAKYTKPFTEEPPKPKENPVQPPIIPEPKKPEDKPLPTPPKKEELPKRPQLKAIASGSNSFVVKSRKATRPSINVERIQYVAEGRVSSANSLVVRTKNEVKRAGSGNSFIIRRM